MHPSPLPIGLSAALLCVPVAAQHSAATQAVPRAIAELDSPARRAHSFAVLTAAGDTALPELREVLRRAAAGGDGAPTERVTLGVLLVLRRLGPRAAAASRDVLDLITGDPDNRLTDSATWTLGQIVIAESEATRKTLMRDLQRRMPCSLEAWDVLNMVLFLGADPPFPVWRQYLDSGSIFATAAATIAGQQPVADNGDMVQALRPALEATLLRHRQRWQDDFTWTLATGEMAAAIAGHGADALVGRGLLAHWDPTVRERGLQILGDARDLTAEQRLDIVARLWDEEPPVAELARATLLGHGARGIVGLRAMRAFERDPATGKRAILFRRAAEALVRAASENSTPATAALVAAADRTLAGERDVVPTIAIDAAACRVFAEIVVGCRGADDDTLPALARLAVANKALAVDHDHALADAFLGSLAEFSPRAWTQAARALVELGPAGVAHVADLPDQLAGAHAIFGTGLPDESVAQLEAALLAGPRASEAQLRTQLASPRWHLAFTAMAMLVERGLVTTADAAALRTFASREFAVVRLQWRGNHLQDLPPPNLYLRAMAALGLTQAGADCSDVPDTLQAAATMFDLPRAEVAAHLRAAHDAGELPAMARRLRRLIDNDPPGSLID
ncbi:MAG: hypothetical protein IT455_17945 [Planctomycetes bacterium]|nr:hypothetical protein [Planctomycetota bacterium]